MAPETVLLTGAAGFIGAHILERLLKAGNFKVVAPLRTASAGESFLQAHPEYPKALMSFPVVPDLRVAGACDDLFKTDDVHYVIHVAGRFQFEGIDVDDLIADNYDTATSLIDSCASHGTSLKRFVLVGSVIVEILGQFDASTFQPTVSEAVLEALPALPLSAELRASGDAVACYTAAKLAAGLHLRSAAEGGAWDWVELLPAGTCGPIAGRPSSSSSLSSSHSLDWARNLLTGAWGDAHGGPPAVPMFQVVDVRDLAAAAVMALTEQRAAGQRINVVNEQSRYDHWVLADVVRATVPERADMLPGKRSEALRTEEAKRFYTISNAKSREVFGESLVYRPERETYVDYVESVWRALK